MRVNFILRVYSWERWHDMMTPQRDIQNIMKKNLLELLGLRFSTPTTDKLNELDTAANSRTIYDF